MKKFPLTLGAGALALALSLTGCSTANAPTTENTSSVSAPSSAVNDADKMFVTMMIPHHQQAIEMSDIVLAKPGIDPQVSKLAQQIKDAQGPEINEMRGWLTAWGVKEQTPSDGMGGMGHGDGMMSDADMETLKAANTADANRLFLTQMIAHHKGAVDMAKTEVAGGKTPDAVALAKKVIEAQTAEITTMQQMLGQM